MSQSSDVRHSVFPHIPVSNMSAGTTISGYYILQSPALRTANSGKSFMTGIAADRTGTVSVIVWDYAGPISAADDGKVVYLHGQLSEFRGALQITLDNVRLTDDQDAVDLSTLVRVAPIDPDQMEQDILSLVDSIADEDYRAVCREFLRCHTRELLLIPAAKSVHHGFLHGLLMHTGNMMKTAAFLADLYPDVVDRSLLLAGTLLHDFAKREEFTFSALGLVNGYSVKGQLLGHLVMGAMDVSRICRELGTPEQKAVLLEHLLLAHHGKPEYGAAVIPQCAESDLLSLIDMTDSRMEIYRENLEQVPLGQFSGRIFALDGHRIYRHYDSNQ